MSKAPVSVHGLNTRRLNIQYLYLLTTLWKHKELTCVHIQSYVRFENPVAKYSIFRRSLRLSAKYACLVYFRSLKICLSSGEVLRENWMQVLKSWNGNRLYRLRLNQSIFSMSRSCQKTGYRSSGGQLEVKKLISKSDKVVIESPLKVCSRIGIVYQNLTMIRNCKRLAVWKHNCRINSYYICN